MRVGFVAALLMLSMMGFMLDNITIGATPDACRVQNLETTTDIVYTPTGNTAMSEACADLTRFQEFTNNLEAVTSGNIFQALWRSALMVGDIGGMMADVVTWNYDFFDISFFWVIRLFLILGTTGMMLWAFLGFLTGLRGGLR